ncbi:MAG: flagella basal body P-ring formation protein FlgA [Planctomycetales bacterium 12-60-4]|nr:MAG: flagella basal body P-ring formation protein FlgA [Planctomycetales bacterium 12-60-4]
MSAWHTYFLAVILLAVVESTSDGAVIELRDQAAIGQKGMIELGDVAQIVDADAEFVERLKHLPLTPAPAAGRSVRLPFEEIRSRLQAHGVNLAEVEFRGQLSTEVRAEEARPVHVPDERALKTQTRASLVTRSRPRQIPPSQIEEDKAREILTDAFRRAFRTGPLEAQGWRIRCEAESQDVRRVKAMYSEEIHFREGRVSPGTSQKLTAWWEDAAGETVEITVGVMIERTPQVLSVKQNLPTGAILRPDDLAWINADEETAGVTRIADVIGKQAARNLRAGQPLKMTDVASVPLIRANDIVTVSVQRSGVTVRRTFKALSTGAMDETVNLSAIDDPRIRIQAVVTGYHEASLSVDTEPQSRVAPQRGGYIEYVTPTTVTGAGGVP